MEEEESVTLWFLAELIGAFLVAYLLVDVSMAYAKGTGFEKLNLAKDTAMQIDSLLSVPEDAYIINSNFHDYSLRITDNKVEVFENPNEASKGTYYFIKSGDSGLNVFLQKPKQVVVSKINNKIAVSEQVPELK